MNVLVTGASGYVGSQLVPVLLQGGHYVICVTRDVRKLTSRFPRRVDVVEADALCPESLGSALRGVDVAYYLIHSLNAGERQFRAADLVAVRIFATTAKAAGVRRFIYLGGVGDPKSHLSTHLQAVTRPANVSARMALHSQTSVPQSLWRWQRFVRDDSLSDACLARPRSEGMTIDIGSPSVETYRSMMLKYAAYRGLRRPLLQVPVLTPRLSSYWVDFVTPIPPSISRPLIEGLRSEVVCRSSVARDIFPQIHPITYEAALSRCLRVPNLPGFGRPPDSSGPSPRPAAADPGR